MSDKNEQPATAKNPSHVVYQVREGKDDKGFWTRIGAAWPHNDAKGYNVSLDSIPLDGRLVLRVVSDKKE